MTSDWLKKSEWASTTLTLHRRTRRIEEIRRQGDKKCHSQNGWHVVDTCWLWMDAMQSMEMCVGFLRVRKLFFFMVMSSFCCFSELQWLHPLLWVFMVTSLIFERLEFQMNMNRRGLRFKNSLVRGPGFWSSSFRKCLRFCCCNDGWPMVVWGDRIWRNCVDMHKMVGQMTMNNNIHWENTSRDW